MLEPLSSQGPHLIFVDNVSTITIPASHGLFITSLFIYLRNKVSGFYIFLLQIKTSLNHFNILKYIGEVILNVPLRKITCKTLGSRFKSGLSQVTGNLCQYFISILRQTCWNLILNMCYVPYGYQPTNFMAYGTRRFNAVFTRILQNPYPEPNQPNSS